MREQVVLLLVEMAVEMDEDQRHARNQGEEISSPICWGGAEHVGNEA